MRKRDFWDIDDLLAEEEPVSLVSSKEIRGLGHLDRNNKSADLPQNRRIEVPFWLGLILSQRVLAELELPKYLKDSYRYAIRADPALINLRGQSPYFFELGETVAKCLENTQELSNLLVKTFILRIKHIVDYADTKSNPNIMRKLTEIEVRIYQDYKRTLQEFIDWKQRKFERLRVSSEIARNHKRVRLAEHC